MFVYNVKLNKNVIFKILLAMFAIICISLAFVAIFKIFKETRERRF